jgi:hypothetical protein
MHGNSLSLSGIAGVVQFTGFTVISSTSSLFTCAVYLIMLSIFADRGNQAVNEELEVVVMMERKDLPLLSIGYHLASVATLYYLFWTLVLSCHCHNTWERVNSPVWSITTVRICSELRLSYSDRGYLSRPKCKISKNDELIMSTLCVVTLFKQ